MIITKKLALVGLLAFSAILANRASATPITGDVFIQANSSSVGVNFATNQVTFTPAAPLVNAKVNSATGDFGGLVGSTVVYSNFNYTVGSFAPVTLWKIFGSTTDFFQLDSITAATETGSTSSGGGALTVFGTGIAHLNGFVPTAGFWSFSANKSTGIKFNFSDTNNVAPVPDNGLTAILMGVSLIGVGIAARSLKKRAKA